MKGGPEKELWDQYAKRLKWPLALKEVEERKPLKPAQLMKREAELLTKAIPKGASLVALDRSGKNLSSPDLAGKFHSWMNDGLADVCFIIGGAEGLHGDVLSKADLKLALGSLTWPHMLARCMLIEQIYRAQCILSNHPYHR